MKKRIKSGAEMSKKLSKMSLEELWQLFPIYMTDANLWRKS